MIFIYPMLTSKSVSTSIIPGICKILERYLLVYSMDSVLKAFAVTNAGKIAKTAGVLNVREDELLYLDEQGRGKPQVDPNDIPVVGRLKIDKTEDDSKNTINFPKVTGWDAISIEPTWITVKSGLIGGEQILGVKVVPFPIDSPGNVVEALIKDKASNTIEYGIKKWGRTLSKLIFMALRTIKAPGLPSLSNDPRKDILFAPSKYGKNIFLCLSKLDLNESNLMENPKTVKKLFNMGWTSTIIADDVNKEANFCMEEYSGLCSTLNYGFLYSTLSRGHSEVFDSITDVKKSAAPFFNKRTRMSSILGEALAGKKMGDMLIRKKKREVIVEDVDNFVDVNKSTILKKIKEVKDGIDTGNLNKINLASVGLPEPPFESMIKEKDIKDRYNFAKRVLKNSTNYSDSTVHKISSVIAIGSSEAENPIDATKKGIKLFAEGVEGKTGITLIKYILWAGYAFIVGVLMKRAFAQFKTFSVTNILKYLTPADVVKGVKKFVGSPTAIRSNFWLFLILGVIYIITDLVKHEEELRNAE